MGFNNLNRLTSVARSDGPTRTLTHDARGNVLRQGYFSQGGVEFTYDHANQPITMSRSATGTFQYDGNYKRVKQTINGETIYSVYSRSGALLFRRNNSDSTKTTDYFQLGGRTVVRLEGGGSSLVVTYPHTDHLGTAAAATDNSGAVIWREAFTPYGEVWGPEAAANDNQRGFTGHIRDTASGLTYMQARYYDPECGCFLSPDPVGFAEGGPDYFARYPYVNNNPVNFWDPDGRRRQDGPGVERRADAMAAVGREMMSPEQRAFRGGLSMGLEGRAAMIEAGTQGADKFFHCRTMCEITQEFGPIRLNLWAICEKQWISYLKMLPNLRLRQINLPIRWVEMLEQEVQILVPIPVVFWPLEVLMILNLKLAQHQWTPLGSRHSSNQITLW